jgi:hypothetical protein
MFEEVRAGGVLVGHDLYHSIIKSVIYFYNFFVTIYYTVQCNLVQSILLCVMN